MKNKKIKKFLSYSYNYKYLVSSSFFIIEYGNSCSSVKEDNVLSSKSLTKNSLKNVELSKFLPVNSLKFPVTIKFFSKEHQLLSHVKNKLDNKASKTVFISTKRFASRSISSNLQKSLSVGNFFNSLKMSTSRLILLLKYLEIKART
jgi:hypothetical protein